MRNACESTRALKHMHGGMQSLWSLRFHILFGVAGLALLFTLTLSSVYASVTLADFSAVRDSDAQVTVSWDTATELDIAGFFVRRSSDVDGTYTAISEFIPAEGDGLTGAVYSFVDDDAASDEDLYYQLEVVNNDQSSTTYGPLVASPDTLSLEDGDTTIYLPIIVR